MRAGSLARRETKTGPGLSDFEKVLRAQSTELADRINAIANTLEEAGWMPQLRCRRTQVTQLQEKPVADLREFFEIETASAV